MEALEAVAAIHRELSCSLCHKPMRDPQTFNTPMCGHTFCRECVIATLEGPGIVKSQCPTCRQPSWKKDLHTNHKYTAISEATAQLEAVLRDQGLDFGLFDGLDEPAPTRPAPAASGGKAAAADHKAAGTAAGIPRPSAAADHAESDAEEPTGLAVVTIRQPAVAPCSEAGNAAAAAAAAAVATAPQTQHRTAVGSGSAEVTALEEPGAMAVQANSDPTEQQQPICSVPEDSRPDLVLPVAHADACFAAAVVESPIAIAAAAVQSLRLPSQQQRVQQHQLDKHPVTAPPSHLQQLLDSQHEGQLPGHAYWQFQQLLANMLCEAAISVQQQQDEQEPANHLPEKFCEQLSKLPVPTEAELQQMQADLWQIDRLISDIDTQIEVVVQQQLPEEEEEEEEQQQQQHPEQPQGERRVAPLVFSAEEPMEAPNTAKGLQEQQLQPLPPAEAAAAAASGLMGPLGKRRRGRASGRSRAAGALSNTACSSGAAGVSGGPAGACSGGMVSFSNCSGPLLEHKRSRPSLEKAFTDAMAAAEQAADLQGAVGVETGGAAAAQRQVQQHQQDEQQQQQEQGAVEAPGSVDLNGRSVYDRTKRRARARKAAAVGATNSGSVTSGAEIGRRRSRRAATAAGRAAGAQSQHASVELARSLVGLYVAVLWPEDREYYSGFITSYNPRSKRHTVAYDDGDEERLDLDVEVWHTLSPQKSSDCHQQQTTQHSVQPSEPAAGEVTDDDEQQQQQLQLQRRNEQQQVLSQPQGPALMHAPAGDAPELTDAQQPPGHLEGQNMQGLPQQQQQQRSIYSMQQQLLRAKGLARCGQPPKQQQQSMYELQQQLLAAKGLSHGRQQQQPQPSNKHKRAKATAAGKRKRQQHCGSDCEVLSSNSSSLCGSDVTSGGDSAYEADEDALDNSDSEECAAAGARGAAVVVESGCESDLEVAAAGSDASDGFMEQQRSRKTKTKRKQQTAAKRRQQQQKRRCRLGQLVEAVWHKKQHHQQQGSRQLSEPPRPDQQAALLLPESDAELDEAAVGAAAAGQVQMGLAATASRQQQQRRRQCRSDQLLQREIESAWAAMAPGLYTPQLSSTTDEAEDSDPNSDMQGDCDSPTQPAGRSSEDDSPASEAAASEQAELQQQPPDHQQQQQQQRKPKEAHAVACPSNLAQQQQEQHGQHCCEQSMLLEKDAAAHLCSHQRQLPPLPHRFPAAFTRGMSTTPGAAVGGPAKVTHHYDANNKYCDLLSDSAPTSSSVQEQESSEEQDENAVAGAARQHPQLELMPHTAAGATGVARPLGISRTAHLQLTATSQRRPLDAVVMGKQQVTHTAVIAGARLTAVSTERAKASLDLTAATAGLRVTSSAAAAAKQQSGPTEAAAADDDTDGTADGADYIPIVTLVGKQYADAFKPQVKALGAVMSPTNKYTYCVVLHVDEEGFFSNANKDVLKALVMGVPLVEHAWLEHSLQQGRLLPVEGYTPKGYTRADHSFRLEGGPDRSTATGRDDKRLFKDYVIVLPALQPTAQQLQTQKHLAQLAQMGHAQVVLQGPTLDKLAMGTLKEPIDAATAAQLRVHQQVLVVLFGDVEPSAIYALQQQWPTAKLLLADYISDCICAYTMLDAGGYSI